MLMSSNRFKRQLPKKPLRTAARLITCLVLAPFLFAAIYAVAVLLISALWWLCGLIGDSQILFPCAMCGLVFAALWSAWEIRSHRKLYRRYLEQQPKGDIAQLIADSSGSFSRIDRRIAADVLTQQVSA